MTASLLLLSSVAGVFVAPSPAGAVDNNRWLVWVSDAGFSQKLIKATVGDQVTFQLDLQNAATQHTVTWDRGHLEVELTREKPSVTFPMNNPGKAYYWDRHHIQDPNADAFMGTLEVAAAPPPSSSTTSSSTSTTVTTAPTTTSTMPTTTTTAPTAIRPQLVSDPPTTTTTAAPQPPSTPSSGSPAPPANDKKDKEKDKGKAKAASTQTSTTAAPAPPEAPALELIFDPASLTPGPTMIPEPPSTDTTDAAALDAAAAASLLDAPKADDDGSKLMLMALGGLAVLLLLGGGWGWFNRASQYDPA